MYYMTPQGKFARRAESGCSIGSSSQQELKFHFMSILHHMKVRQMDSDNEGCKILALCCHVWTGRVA